MTDDTDAIYAANAVAWLRTDDAVMVKLLAQELGITSEEVIHEALLLMANTRERCAT